MQIEKFRNMLDEHEALCSCYELHGLLCGMLTVDISTRFKRWTQEAQKMGVAPNCFEGSLMAIWQALFTGIVEQLIRGDLRFRPLLSEDANDDYDVRVRALIDWCNGFMYGIGITDPKFERNLSKVSKKILADVNEITLADWTILPGKNQIENEVAYQSAVEYLGIGVVMMCDEIVAKKDKRQYH